MMFRPLIAGMVFAGLASWTTHASAAYVLTGTIAVPSGADNNVGGKFVTYDISFFDPITQLDYVADRSNASIDIFSAATNSFVGRIGGSGHLFAGQMSSNDTSGPDGVQVVNLAGQHQVFGGNGPSTLLGFNINSPTSNAQFLTLATGTPDQNRVDEMSFDPNSRHLLTANNAAPTPFASLVDTRPGSATQGQVIRKITFDGTNNTPIAGAGIEASDYDAVTNKFYLSIPQIGNNASNPGGVVEIDPNTGAVLRTIDFASFGISSCSPTGLSAAASGQIMVGCGNAGQSIILDPTKTGNGVFVKAITQVSGEDQVWYDPLSNNWFLAARFDPDGPVLGIVGAATDDFIQNLATSFNDHSVAVDPISGEVFVPFGADASNTVCANGCIAIFQNIPEPPVVALSFAGLAIIVGRRRRSGTSSFAATASPTVAGC
jgi:hypothetical protein